MSLWNAPIESITFDHVQGFCALQLRENIRLEYKENFSGRDPGRQVAKEVSALANTHGGLIIYGVAETDDRMPEPNPEGQELGPNARDRVIQTCHYHVFPPLDPEISEFIANPRRERRGFLVIRVAASADAPHAISDGKEVFIRVQDKSELDRAPLSRIEYMLERRKGRTSAQAERVQRGVGRLLSALDVRQSPLPNPTGYIAVAIGPTIQDEPNRELAMLAAKHLPSWRPTPLAVADGVCSFSPDYSCAWTADDFGNVIFVRSGNNLVDSVTTGPSAAYFDWLDRSHEIDVVPIQEALEPLLRCTAAWCNMACEEAYYGELSIRVEVNTLLQHPLAFGSSARAELPAASKTDWDAEFSFRIASSAIGQEGWAVSLQAADRLLWSWGLQPSASAKKLLDLAERSIFGEVVCPNADPKRGGHPQRPLNHDLCLMCRERPPTRAGDENRDIIT